MDTEDMGRAIIDFRDARPIKYIQYESLGTEHTVSPESFEREREVLRSKGEAPPRGLRYFPQPSEKLLPANPEEFISEADMVLGREFSRYTPGFKVQVFHLPIPKEARFSIIYGNIDNKNKIITILLWEGGTREDAMAILAHEYAHVKPGTAEIEKGVGEVETWRRGAHFAKQWGVLTQYRSAAKELAEWYSSAGVYPRIVKGIRQWLAEEQAAAVGQEKLLPALKPRRLPQTKETQSENIWVLEKGVFPSAEKQINKRLEHWARITNVSIPEIHFADINDFFYDFKTKCIYLPKELGVLFETQVKNSDKLWYFIAHEFAHHSFNETKAYFENEQAEEGASYRLAHKLTGVHGLEALRALKALLPEVKREIEEREDKLIPALKPFDPYKFADYVLRNNVFSDTDIFVYSGLSGTNPHRVPDHIWAEVLADMGGEFIKTGDLYVVHTPGVERPPTMRAAPTWREPSGELSLETIEDREYQPRTQFIEIGERVRYIGSSKYRYKDWPEGAWLQKDVEGTVTEYHPEISAPPIEGEEGIPAYAVVTWDFGGKTALDAEYEGEQWERIGSINLLAKTEGDPLSKFCCRQCGECAPVELLEEGRFPDRIAWLRSHYKAKHPGMWGKVAVTPVTPEVTKLTWREGTLPNTREADYKGHTIVENLKPAGMQVRYYAIDPRRYHHAMFNELSDVITKIDAETAIPKAEAGMPETGFTVEEYATRQGIGIAEASRELADKAIKGEVESLGGQKYRGIAEAIPEAAVIPTEPSLPSPKQEFPIFYEARLWRKWANMDDVIRAFATEQEAYDYLTHLKYIAKAGDKLTIKRSQEWDIKVLHRETIDKDGQFWAIRKPFEPIPTEPIGGSSSKQAAVIPTQPSSPNPKEELEFVSDSPEFLAFTIDDIGYREKLDTAFQTAIARAKGG